VYFRTLRAAWLWAFTRASETPLQLVRPQQKGVFISLRGRQARKLRLGSLPGPALIKAEVAGGCGVEIPGEVEPEIYCRPQTSFKATACTVRSVVSRSRHGSARR
jgi:hypothetical protein